MLLGNEKLEKQNWFPFRQDLEELPRLESDEDDNQDDAIDTMAHFEEEDQDDAELQEDRKFLHTEAIDTGDITDSTCHLMVIPRSDR